MGTKVILGAVIVSPVVFSLIVLRWVPEPWLQALALSGYSLGRRV